MMKGAMILSLVSSIAAFGGTAEQDVCPFLTSTDNDHLECNDGTFCQVPTDPTADSPQWACCNDHGGRKRCPATMVMCEHPANCAGASDHCCEFDCHETHVSVAAKDELRKCVLDDSCPFLTTTGDDQLECHDGTFCQVPTDPTADSPQWTCCNHHGGRKRCPATMTMCAHPNNCAGGKDHCCEFDCHETHVSTVAKDEDLLCMPESEPKCKHMISTDQNFQMACNDGSFCTVPTDPSADSDQWACCNDHGLRKRCPATFHMCANPTGCAGSSDHCCEFDCADVDDVALPCE